MSKSITQDKSTDESLRIKTKLPYKGVWITVITFAVLSAIRGERGRHESKINQDGRSKGDRNNQP